MFFIKLFLKLRWTNENICLIYVISGLSVTVGKVFIFVHKQLSASVSLELELHVCIVCTKVPVEKTKYELANTGDLQSCFH